MITESDSTQIKHEESSIQTDRREKRSKEKFNTMSGTSLVVQWLRLHALNAGAQVQSLARELRSHTP